MEGRQTLIKSDATIKGKLDGATGSFSGEISAKDFKFAGIEAGDILFVSLFDGSSVIDPPNGYKISIWATWTGTPKELDFKMYKNNKVVIKKNFLSANSGKL